MERPLTISVIIPAFNEESHIGACLDSLMAQTVAADEIIVVDNNSADHTVQIAQQYPNVTILRELKQGLIPARNKGLHTATGSILARIDADTYVQQGWVECIHEIYSDQTVMAATGPALVEGVPFIPGSKSTLWTRAYLFGARWCFNVPVLWGANMTIRQSVWRSVSHELHTDSDYVHEDQDLSVILAKHRFHVKIDPNLLVAASPAAQKYSSYMRKFFRTYWLHRHNQTLVNARKLYAPLQRLALFFVAIVPLKLLFLTLWTLGWVSHRVILRVNGYHYASATQSTD